MTCKNLFFILFLIPVFHSCSQDPGLPAEAWADKPVGEWPDMCLVSDVEIGDTSFTAYANAFLIDTGTDTLVATCKHWFMLFGSQGITHIDLKDQLKKWEVYPKNKPAKRIRIGHPINTNPKEEIGQFNTLKVRDWIVFRLESPNPGIHPLKIRQSMVQKGEVIYNVGWTHDQKDLSKPGLIKQKCINTPGPYYYTQILSEGKSYKGISGSPVIDGNGYLVGLASGAEGKMSVVASVTYLKEILQKNGYLIEDHS